MVHVLDYSCGILQGKIDLLNLLEHTLEKQKVLLWYVMLQER
jgi:hypothetical protein